MFAITSGIGLIIIIGIGIYLLSASNTELVETESVHEIDKATEMSQTEDVEIAADIPETTQPSTIDIDSGTLIDFDKFKEYMNSEDLEKLKNLKNPEDIQQFIEKLKEKMEPDTQSKFKQVAKTWFDQFDGIQSGDRMPDMDMQELYDLIAPAFGKIDLAETSMMVFRQRFPEGEPADYERQMAERLHEVVAKTSGEFEEVMLDVTIKLATDQDYNAWVLGQFQGKIGQQMEWMMEEIIVAGQLEGIEYSIPDNISQNVSSLTKVETPESITSMQTSNNTAAQRESEDNLPSLLNNLSSLLNKDKRGTTSSSKDGTSTPLPPKRIAAIRETLTLHGTETGMLRLLETDKEAANWLLKQFDTPAKIDVWLSEQRAKVPSGKIPTEPVSPKTQP